ncbi:hypothetical protein RRG08_051512 [Elysia crispata]|uniref:Uncharacterized protein n=1 Tax=Elysia crispata TaxID=231223 RepID=A0AAE1B6J2_9GAST|nr:hypothetical protein RRG08_051512 [Elysia crispata]
MALTSRDLDDLKPLLSETVKQMLGFSEPTVVAAALNCVSTGYDMKKTIDQLSRILDGSQAASLAERVHILYEDFKGKSRSLKKRRKDIEVEESIKRRKYLEEDEIEIAEIAMVQTPAAPPKPKNTLPNLYPPGSQLTPDKIKEMMANAQKMIQERKAQLGATLSGGGVAMQGGLLPTPNMPPSMAMPAPGAGQFPTAAGADAALQKARRAAELQAQIQARLTNLATTGLPPPLIPGLQGPPPPGVPLPKTGSQPLARPSPLILNEEGKTVDAKTGEAVQLTSYTPTLKANIRAKRREQFKGLIDRPPEEISEGKFFDPRVPLNGFQRQKRSFKFHERGKFEQQAIRLRAKAQLERLQAEIAQAAKKTGIASAAKIATITPKKEIKEGEVPDIEWWDSFILRRDSYDSIPDEGEIDPQFLDGITHLVEHPTQIAPPVEQKEDISVPVYLTKKERKKLRRQNRREAEKEIQEKIRLGLAPPLEPKDRRVWKFLTRYNVMPGWAEGKIFIFDPPLCL